MNTEPSGTLCWCWSLCSVNTSSQVCTTHFYQSRESGSVNTPQQAPVTAFLDVSTLGLGRHLLEADFLSSFPLDRSLPPPPPPRQTPSPLVDRMTERLCYLPLRSVISLQCVCICLTNFAVSSNKGIKLET